MGKARIKIGPLQRLYDRERRVKEAVTVDHGTDGPAQLRRLHREAETIQAGVTVRVMEDEGPIGHYRRGALLTDRQCDALERLARLYDAAGRKTALAGGYGSRVACHGEMTDDQAAAWRAYCQLLDRAPATTRVACSSVARGEFPTMANRISYLRDGGDAMADHLRLPR